MRPLSAIASILLLGGGVLAGSPAAPARADGMPLAVAKPGCRCPGVRHVNRLRHPHRYARRFVQRVALVPVAPLPYNAPIPSPYNPAYDRGMTLHFRSPAVSATWVDEAGFPHTPPIEPVQWYRTPTGFGVVQYDGLTGEYIRLAQSDALRAFPPGPPPMPPPGPPLGLPPGPPAP